MSVIPSLAVDGCHFISLMPGSFSTFFSLSNLSFIYSILQQKLMTPAFAFTSKPSCGGSNSYNLCLPSILYFPKLVFVKWSLNRIQWNHVEHLLKFWIHDPIPYLQKSESLLDGDWLVCVFKLMFQDILYTLKFENQCPRCWVNSSHSGAQGFIGS